MTEKSGSDITLLLELGKNKQTEMKNMIFFFKYQSWIIQTAFRKLKKDLVIFSRLAKCG